MLEAIKALASGIVKPIAVLIDAVHTSDEEKLKLRNGLIEIENDITTQLLGFYTTVVEAQKSIVVAEAQGESWLQRNWRPMLMMLFGIIIFNNYVFNPYMREIFGVSVIMEIPADMWSLLKIGVGGYIPGRSLEKIAPKVLEIYKERNNKDGAK